jgi:3'-5' exoribonuclease
LEAWSQPLLKDIGEGERIKGFYLIKEKRTGTTRNGNAFLGLMLSDQSGSIDAKIWDRAEKFGSLFSEGDIVHIEGETESYRNQLQVRINSLRPCEEDVDPSLFIESSPFDPSEMMASLKEILQTVKDIHLRRIIDKFLDDKTFTARFRKAPAAKNFHHSYISGLLEHTLSVCRLSVEVAKLYPHMDRDLLVTSAYLHDIGKTRELSFKVKIDYTDEGRLLGHLVLGAEMIDEKIKKLKGFPYDLSVRLKHVVLSHHGQYEFGSPKRPKFLEAVTLHMLDDMDAKINGLGLYMERDRSDGSWTDFNRLFGQYFLKGPISKEDQRRDLKTEEDEKQGSLF